MSRRRLAFILAWLALLLRLPLAHAISTLATPTATTTPATPQATEYVWAVRASKVHSFGNFITVGRTAAPGNYEGVIFPPQVTYKWAFFSSAQEALESYGDYWRRHDFVPFPPSWVYYLLCWVDKGRFPYVHIPGSGHRFHARFSLDRVIAAPSAVYALPFRFRLNPGKFVVNRAVLEEVYLQRVPAPSRTHHAIRNSVVNRSDRYGQWLQRAAVHLQARCPTESHLRTNPRTPIAPPLLQTPLPAPDPASGSSQASNSQASTSVEDMMDMDSDCYAAINNILQNDMPGVQDWVQEIADLAGVSCTRQRCSLQNCQEAVSDVVSQKSESLKQHVRAMASSLGMRCIDIEGKSDAGCSDAIDRAMDQDKPWVSEMLELLLQHARVVGCFGDWSLLNDVLEHIEERFSLTRDQLVELLHNGPRWLNQHFPELFLVISEFAKASLSTAKCFNKKDHYGKRDLGAPNHDIQEALCYELLSGIKLGLGRRPSVYFCKNDLFHPPCGHVDAPINVCVNMPEWVDKKASSLRPDVSAGNCTFYKGHGCTSRNFSASYPGKSLVANGVVNDFNDQISSFHCSGHKSLPPDESIRGCKAIDGLTVWLQLGSGWTAGTWSTIKMSFSRWPHAHLLAEKPRAGTCVRRDIDTRAAFGSPVVPASLLDGFALWDYLGSGVLESPALLGADAWIFQSIRIDAHCANADKTLVYQELVDAKVQHNTKLALPTLIFSTTISPTQWLVPQTLPHTCAVILHDSAELPAPDACTHISGLKLDIELGNGYYQGTWDTLILYFGQREKHRIVRGPDPGFHEIQAINLRAVFGQSKIPLTRITKVQLYHYHNADFGDDDWVLKGLKLRARCAHSLSEIQLSKYGNVNYPVTGITASWGQSQRAWSGPVSASRDWHKLFECTSLDFLWVRIYLGDKPSGGTNDDIYVKFGSAKHTPVFLIASQPSRGTTHTISINIRQICGAPSVPVQDLNSFSIFSRPHAGNSLDQWELGEVTILGRCAGSEKHVAVTRHRNVYDWFTRDKPYTRPLPLSDWHLADDSGKLINPRIEF